MNFKANIEGNDDANVLANDVGGEDRGSCSPAMPRGGVVCVACRTQPYLALMLVEEGFDLSPGRM